MKNDVWLTPPALLPIFRGTCLLIVKGLFGNSRAFLLKQEKGIAKLKMIVGKAN